MSFEYRPNRRPPRSELGALGWLKQNLFSSPSNALLTVSALAFLGWVLPPLLNWAVFKADFRGQSALDCQSGGACWVFVKVQFQAFMFGFYPESERWRVALVFLGYVPLFGLWIWRCCPIKRLKHIGITLILLPLLTWWTLYGGVFGLSVVRTELWGGMLLTFVVASVGLLFSLPLGIVLALMRRSEMPLIKGFSIVFIELWRGVPLVTVLFMANVLLPLFLPSHFHVDNLLRALIGVALFASAYMAEVIRGGLQAIPRGQYEAADSLGLGYYHKMRLVILPQAVRTVIPGITNTFVGLLKDTTLVSIIGLYDFLGIVHSASQDSRWLGHSLEGYAFCAFVYFILCYGMSATSLRIEQHYSGASQR